MSDIDALLKFVVIYHRLDLEKESRKFLIFSKFFDFENLLTENVLTLWFYWLWKVFLLWKFVSTFNFFLWNFFDWEFFLSLDYFFTFFFFTMKYFLTIKYFLILKFFYSKNSSDWIFRKYTDWKNFNFEIFFQLWAFFDSEKCFQRKCFRHWKIWIFHVIIFSNSLIRCCIFQQCFSFRYLLLYTVKTSFQYCIKYYLSKVVSIKWLDKVF